MAADLNRIVRAGLAALESGPADQPKKKNKRRLSSGRALILGAGLMTAGRLVARSRAEHVLDRTLDGVDQLVDEVRGQEDMDEPSARADEELPEEEEGAEDEAEPEDEDEDEAEPDEDEEEPEDEAEPDEDEDEDEEADEALGEDGNQPDRRPRAFRPSPVRVAKGGRMPVA